MSSWSSSSWGVPLGPVVGRGVGAAVGRGVGAAVGEAINIALKEGLAKVLRGNTGGGGGGPGVEKPGSGVPTRQQLAGFPTGILPAGQNINRVGRGTKTSPGLAPPDLNSPDVGSFQNTRTRRADVLKFQKNQNKPTSVVIGFKKSKKGGKRFQSTDTWKK